MALPRVHIEDFYYSTDLDEAYHNARLSIELNLANKEGIKASGYTLLVDVKDEHETSILDEELSKTVALSGKLHQASSAEPWHRTRRRT